MVSKFRQKTAVFLFWPAVLTYLITSCVSVGSVDLSSKHAEKIIPGKTTKGEISVVLGEPEQILRLDKKTPDLKAECWCLTKNARLQRSGVSV